MIRITVDSSELEKRLSDNDTKIQTLVSDIQNINTQLNKLFDSINTLQTQIIQTQTTVLELQNKDIQDTKTLYTKLIEKLTEVFNTKKSRLKTITVKPD